MRSRLVSIRVVLLSIILAALPSYSHADDEYSGTLKARLSDGNLQAYLVNWVTEHVAKNPVDHQRIQVG